MLAPVTTIADDRRRTDGVWHMRRVIGASKHLIVGWVGKDRGVRRMVCVALADSRT